MDLKLTSTVDDDNIIEGDLHLDAGDVVWMYESDEEIAQHIRVRLRMLKGEWFQNVNDGVPYFDEIFDKGVADGRVSSIIQRVIVGTPGVASLNEFSLVVDRETRAMTVTFEAVRDDGHVFSSADFGDFIVEV